MFEKTLEMCGMLNDPDSPKFGKHRELELAEIKKSEEAVQRTMTAIHNFTNQFTVPDKHRLYSLASGAPVSAEIEYDVLQAEAIGKAAKGEFISTRFRPSSSQSSFFDAVKKQKLLTMDNNSKKVTLTSTKGKVCMSKSGSFVPFVIVLIMDKLRRILVLFSAGSVSRTEQPCLSTAGKIPTA